MNNVIRQHPGPQEQEVSLFHLNARSVRNKLSYREDIASEFYIRNSLESEYQYY